MNKKSNYKTAGILSIIYAISPFLPYLIGGPGLIQIFLMVSFPYIMYKLRDYIRFKYNYRKASIFFNILVLLLICSFIMMTLGIIIIDIFDTAQKYSNSFVRLSSFLLTLRGIVLVVIGVLLIKKFVEFDFVLRTISICLVLFGFQTILASSVGVWPGLLMLLPKTYSILLLNCLKALLPIMELIMFGSIGYAFVKNNKDVDENSISVN